jgi:hypothetical protein
MMSVSAHDGISGSPQMVRAWDEFLRYAKGQPGVAFLRKDEIARYIGKPAHTARGRNHLTQPPSPLLEETKTVTTTPASQAVLAVKESGDSAQAGVADLAAA